MLLCTQLGRQPQPHLGSSHSLLSSQHQLHLCREVCSGLLAMPPIPPIDQMLLALACSPEVASLGTYSPKEHWPMKHGTAMLVMFHSVLSEHLECNVEEGELNP